MLLNKADVAAIAQCSTQTLDRHIKAGIGPTITEIGGRVWFADSDVNEWLQHCRRPSPSSAA
jgi:predicted DNA-binding transcriptional regulator AlpA